MIKALLLALAIVFLFSFVLAGCDAKITETPTATDKPTAEETTAPVGSKA